MLKRYMLLINFVLISSFTCYAYSLGSLYNLYKGPWECIEDILIIKPESNLKGFTSRAIRWSGSLLAGFGIGKVTFKYFKKKFKDENVGNKYEVWDEDNRRDRTLIFLSALASSGLSYFFVTAIYRYALERRAFNNFVSVWPEQKEYTPKEFHATFDELNKLYKHDNSKYKDESGEVLRVVRSVIHDHFSPKYSHNSSDNKFFDYKNLVASVNCDIAKIIRVIAKMAGI